MCLTSVDPAVWAVLALPPTLCRAALGTCTFQGVPTAAATALHCPPGPPASTAHASVRVNGAALHTQVIFTNGEDKVEEPGCLPAGPGTALHRQQRIQEGLEGEGGLGVRQRGNDEVKDLVCERGRQTLLCEGRKHLLPTKEKCALFNKIAARCS